MNHLYARLKAETTCPVCGSPVMPITQQQEQLHIVRYQCSAVFGVSDILQVVNIYDPCPTPSQVAASHLMTEAELAAENQHEQSRQEVVL
ncbi:hypothetical protein [Rhizobium paknamense]|uniref:Zinc finger Ogr/Delta-type domain-containing protein n=1 Tax=Rhizobium paknamense TaxID=1206817 RepID=A0ABU0IAK8_9HYPH|nr:hypothetical protein [Rhizobium paknamense]MDQ0454688.1 hypothetical protein [Rhizobium paknamense]